MWRLRPIYDRVKSLIERRFRIKVASGGDPPPWSRRWSATRPLDSVLWYGSYIGPMRSDDQGMALWMVMM